MGPKFGAVVFHLPRRRHPLAIHGTGASMLLFMRAVIRNWARSSRITSSLTPYPKNSAYPGCDDFALTGPFYFACQTVSDVNSGRWYRRRWRYVRDYSQQSCRQQSSSMLVRPSIGEDRIDRH